MPVFTVVVDTLDKKEQYLTAMRKLFPSIKDRHRHGIKERGMYGKEPCFEIIAPKEMNYTVYDARHSILWEGPDVADELDGMADIIPGRIGEQEKYVARQYGHRDDGRQIRDFVRELPNNGGNLRGFINVFEPNRSERIKVVPADEAETFREQWMENCEQDRNIAIETADKTQDKGGRLPRPWSTEFNANVQHLNPTQLEYYAAICVTQVPGTELEYDLRDLDDGRVLVVVTPKSIPWPAPHLYRLLNEYFPDEDDAGDFGKAILGEIEDIEPLLNQRGMTRVDMKDALNAAEKTLLEEESDLREAGLLASKEN